MRTPGCITERPRGPLINRLPRNITYERSVTLQSRFSRITLHLWNASRKKKEPRGIFWRHVSRPCWNFSHFSPDKVANSVWKRDYFPLQIGCVQLTFYFLHAPGIYYFNYLLYCFMAQLLHINYGQMNHNDVKALCRTMKTIFDSDFGQNCVLWHCEQFGQGRWR